MKTIAHREVLPTTEARARLSQIVGEFERQGARAEPVTFGSHRKPQGVIVPWALWLEILPAVEDRLDVLEALERVEHAGSERVEFDEAAKKLGRDPGSFR
jgi:antitoxin StbD